MNKESAELIWAHGSTRF